MDNPQNTASIPLDSLTLWEAFQEYGEQVLPIWHEQIYDKKHSLESRRYIGCKAKLVDWIFEMIAAHTHDCKSFCDIFAGTGSVANRAITCYNDVIVNDFLPSNNVMYQAFWGEGEWNLNKIIEYLDRYNMLNPKKLRDNYFSKSYGDMFFDNNVAKIVGYIREDLKKNRTKLSFKEYNILLASLMYSIDRIANTLGHFEAYIKKEIAPQRFIMRLINAQSIPSVTIHQQDSNLLARQIHADIVYIDPPYNSRQYSRFYHVYDNLVQWKKPQLFGAAHKPKEENMSDYCRSAAFNAFTDLVTHLDAKYLVVSYNNTYKSKSSSSENKIKLEQIETVLRQCGNTQIFAHAHNPFNSGKTAFDDHKEYLFITEIDNERRNASFPTILCR